MAEDIGMHPTFAGVIYQHVQTVMKAPSVYILASKPRGTLYIGVTSNLVKRTWQHREGCGSGFTSRYDVKTLVWYEQHQTMANAIEREKALKRWPRQRKLELIQKRNPKWRDLWREILGMATGAAPASVTPANVGCMPISSAMVPSLRRDDDFRRTRRE